MKRYLSFAAALFFLVTSAFAGEEAFEANRFGELLQREQPVVVHFHSTYCGTCRQQARVLTELVKRPELSGVTVMRADYGSEKALRERLKVQARSTLVAFKGGKEASRSTGQTDAAALERVMRSAL